jgi:hypothetical protein
MCSRYFYTPEERFVHGILHEDALGREKVAMLASLRQVFCRIAPKFWHSPLAIFQAK